MNPKFQLAFILHSMLCTKEHESEIEELVSSYDSNKCYFYPEQQLSVASIDETPDTKYWLGQAEDLCQSIETTPESLLKDIQVIIEIRQKLTPLLNSNSKKRDLVSALLGL